MSYACSHEAAREILVLGILFGAAIGGCISWLLQDFRHRA
jgi:hypothetical protein